MRTLVVVFASFLVSSCASGAAGTCQTPVADACTEKAQEAASTLVQIAAQQGKTADEMTTEFVNACEGQLQNDLDQTLTDLQAIADAGTQGARK